MIIYSDIYDNMYNRVQIIKLNKKLKENNNIKGNCEQNFVE